MLTGPQFLAANIDAVRSRIATAARAAGRPPESVTLIGVTKGQPAAAAAAARAAGLADLGENYVQEALPKIASVPRNGLSWHFIGQLQANKTRPVAESFDWVHTVDRLKLAERLSAQRPFHGPPLNVCLQVKLADEADKGGVEAAALPELARAIAKLPRLKLRGLMCVPPESTDLAVQRGFFAQLRELGEDLVRSGLALDVLSMGMSGDLEAAVLEGATHVRIGTAIFGPRVRHERAH
ncbi:MAG TPA: YggS family pyridoxal phosphate-dependent enzyme [Steroidobacteraceae bacterium]|nr:YggS family pyridoxal phosphate-dependent enzyme [Steroidobacteraceae bacterium]